MVTESTDKPESTSCSRAVEMLLCMYYSVIKLLLKCHLEGSFTWQARVLIIWCRVCHGPSNNVTWVALCRLLGA